MPAHPAEENASGSITDQVAKDSKDSTASDHSLHDVDTGATSGGSQSKATEGDHKANLGPVQASSMPEKEGSKDDRAAKAASMNN